MCFFPLYIKCFWLICSNSQPFLCLLRLNKKSNIFNNILEDKYFNSFTDIFDHHEQQKLNDKIKTNHKTIRSNT